MLLCYHTSRVIAYKKGGSMAKKEFLQVNVRLPAYLLEKARIRVAKRKEKSLQELVANAVRAYLVANK